MYLNYIMLLLDSADLDAMNEFLEILKLSKLIKKK